MTKQELLEVLNNLDGDDLDIKIEINAPKEKEIECESCNYKFSISPNKKRCYGEYGIPYVVCERCNEKIFLYDEDCLQITPKNIEFPQHFITFGIHNDSVHINDKEIEKWVKETLDYLIKHKDETFYSYASGDSTVIGLSYSDEIRIIVARGYYEFSYDKEEKL